MEADPEGGERLTALGEHLAELPLHPRQGKLVVLGAAFGEARVADDALTIAAALSSRSPFLNPHERRQEVDQLRSKWARALAPAAGMQSDHLAVVAAYEAWSSVPRHGRLDFAKAHLLSNRTLQAMGAMKRSLLEHLSAAGLVRRGLRARDIEAAGRGDSDGCYALLARCGTLGGPRVDEKRRPKLLAALLCAALCPNVVHVTEGAGRKTKAQASGGVMLGEGAKLMIRERASEAPVQVKIHASSVHGGDARKDGVGSPYLVYNELVKTGETVRVRDVTPVPPLAMLLFGGSLEADAAEPGMLSVCGWLRLRAPPQAREVLVRVREGLDATLRRKIDAARSRPGAGGGAAADDADAVGALLEAVVALL